MSRPPLPLTLTMGEAAGIGAEITLKAWHARHTAEVHPFLYVGSVEGLRSTAQSLSLDVPLRETNDPTEAVACWADRLPVLPVETLDAVHPGKPSIGNAAATLRAINLAVDMVKAGRAAGVVTNPVHKSTLYDAGFAHPGHTEYLAELAGGSPTPVMMLVAGTFRTVPITVHLPLAQAITALNTDLIVTTGEIVAADLSRFFGITEPRLALSGLNPHAGEGGKLGAEEQDIIRPAVARLAKSGHHVSGPLSADTMFHEKARQAYDAALCMYHDQALIPIKTVGFDVGVNCTLGLPFIRTSPDHGTALDIAGRGIADARSLIAALNLAGTMAQNARTV